MAAVRAVQTELIGRESELAAVHTFLDGSGGSRALVVAGEPGIGKTALWSAAIDAAAERGYRVLSARASDAEAQMSFAALVDLLDGVDLGGLGLPAPQLHALQVALLREAPEGGGPESHAIGVGLLTTLRSLAAHDPILVALDDSQWIDAASATALVFAARRLEREPIMFVAASRPEPRSRLEDALGRDRLEQLPIGPLSLGGVRRLLWERLGLSLPRPALRRIVDTTLGNPLFVLELGRSLAEHGVPGIGEELQVPETLDGLLGARVESLAEPVRRSLLAVALSADLTPRQLAAIVDAEDLEAGVEAGVLVMDGDRIRAWHPLLAAVATARSNPSERRSLHLDLAALTQNPELRARHLALARDRPDEDLAAEVAAAALAATARGAWQGAAELGEHALRLTPADSPERPKRAFYVCLMLGMVGERERLKRILTKEVEALPPGPDRARLLLVMPAVVGSNDEICRYFERALEESRTDPALQAAVLGNLSFNATAIRVAQVREAERWAEEALPASRADHEIERSVLYALASARALRGRPLDDICERFREITGAASYVLGSPERIAGARLVWRGELDRARRVLSQLLALSDEGGDVLGYAHMRLHMCELELRSGAWDSVDRLLEEWAVPTEREVLGWPAFERCQGLLALGRGDASEAKRWAAEELARGEAVSVPFHELEALRITGCAELLAHDPTGAAVNLRTVWEHTEREGVEEPGALPVAPDLVEALVELGEREEAGAVARRLRDLSEQQDHPWGLATSARCEAHVLLTAGYNEAAALGLEHAAEAYAALGLRFDRARSLLLLGRAERRHRKWGAARRSLERAEAAFDEMGSAGWVEETRAELARVGARRPAPAGRLTPAERRVVELAREGLGNKEIAQTLFVSVKTVEKHLSHAYAKLGVRSRAQLTRGLSQLS